jgi:NAD(P)-dependent dehydrogenase (short-subunit alcohol dehydrogenase family)
MQNQRVLITGGNSGIGKQTAIALARQGAEVIITSRDPERGRQALADIRRAAGHDRVHLAHLDLGSLASVRAFAAGFTQQYGSLDVLIENAGLLAMKRSTTADGFELCFGVNYLGHFLLTELLLNPLQAAPAARIVIVASDAHLKGHLDFSNLQLERGFQWMKAYGNSKLAQVTFTLTLAERLKGSRITVNCVHPGMTRTNIWPRSNWMERMFSGLVCLFAISDTDAAKSVVRLASSPEVAAISGKYFNRLIEAPPAPEATQQDVQQKLWAWSEAATGLSWKTL